MTVPRTDVTAMAALALLTPLSAAKPFDIVWNSPWPSYCKAKVDPAPTFSEYSVRANTNNTFNGNVVWTIYCPTHFSTFPHFATQSDGSAKPVNGGIPQRGNLSMHLDQVRRDVQALFPDPLYDGYAVIDWEV